MRRTHQLILLAIVVAAAVQPTARAQGVDREQLSRALSVLPEVTHFELDDEGHVKVIEGRLTPVGPSPPEAVAPAFMTIHRGVYPTATNSEFHVESVTRSGGMTTVMLVQSVEGFVALDERLEMRFLQGQLVRVGGIALHWGDVPPTDRDPVTRRQALEIADDQRDPQSEIVSASATRVLHGVDHIRSWRVEMLARIRGGLVLETVVVDALDGILVDRRVEEISDPAQGQVLGDPEGSVLGPDGCAPVAPPVGDFTNARGQSQWHGAGTGCGRWEFDPKLEASLFHGNCLDYACPPFPSTSHCDHGEIRRDNLSFDKGHERVQLEFLTPDRPIFMRLRWGPGADQAAPFIVPPGPEALTEIEVDLSWYSTWDSATVASLILELVHDEQVWIRSLDLYPGPWLEFPRGPILDDGAPGDELIEGQPVTVLQDVVNVGCRLAAGTHRTMRLVDYRLYRRKGISWEFEGFACEGVVIPGTFEAEAGVRGLPVCDFPLPQAGTWRLEAAFRHHAAAAVRTRFVVQAVQHPDLSIDATTPVDLYSGNLSGWPCRSDVLDLSRYDDPEPDCALPWVIAIPVTAHGLAAPVDSSVAVWGRTHDPAGDPGVCDPDSVGWHPLAAPRQWTFYDGSDVVDVPLDRGYLEQLELGPDGLSMLDFKVVVDAVANEQEVDDNVLCTTAWIAVVDDGIEDVLGPTWLADDYFLDPAHWPPQGLVWTGVTLEHEEGSADWDPDSALVAMSVDSASNEDPRLIWYEDRSGDTVSGLLIRYRRSRQGFGDGPYLDAGAEEADGLHTFDLAPEGHPNRAVLTADSQWRTLVWRRGAANPFGGFSVPVLEAPVSSGDTLSLHLAPDVNCLVDEPGCPSGIHPTMLVDVVGGWHATDLPPPEPLFVSAGLRLQHFGEWIPIPGQLASGESYEFAVEIRNVGSASGVAVLVAAVEVLVAGESPAVHTMIGSETVTIPPNGSHYLRLYPGWTPTSLGVRRLVGTVRESGQLIGDMDSMVEIVDGGSGCPIPAVDLP